jgi:hypothetical protein
MARPNGPFFDPPPRSNLSTCHLPGSTTGARFCSTDAKDNFARGAVLHAHAKKPPRLIVWNILPLLRLNKLQIHGRQNPREISEPGQT